MSRKDFELIASTIWNALAQAKLATHLNHSYMDGITDVAERMADALASTNPRFDRKRFMDAALNGGLLP